MSDRDGSPPLLRLQGITKRFGSSVVLDQVDLEVMPGEVHALVGENGAGKSTLMHIVAGVCSPDAGRIDFDGVSNLRIHDARQAQELGIATVFQERSLFPHLSVAENIFAGRQPLNRWRGIDHPQLSARARTLLADVGLDMNPNTLVAELSPDQQQRVEIAKALSLQARLIIFDEPTASLTESETRALFQLIVGLRQRRVGVVYISHRLEEIFQIAERVTVLKDGRSQGTRQVALTSPAEVVRLMVGRSVTSQRRQGATQTRANPPRFEARGLSDPPSRHTQRTRLVDISFSAYAGEILGLAGLAGAGRTETALSVIGARPRASGEIFIEGRSTKIESPAQAIAAGIGYLPEDRKSDGLFADLDVVENISAAGLERFGGWWLDERGQQRYAAESRERLGIACRDLRQPIVQLSGGNQQKCILARWLLVNPRILIVDEPTRGVDVGAKAEVHALLQDLSRQGAAVIVISSDLPEILAISDRILVLRQGRLAGELSGATATEEDVMRLASLAPSES